MKLVPPALVALSALASVTAQQWVDLDPAPSGLVGAMFDPGRQRALVVSYMTGTWSFDGSQWQRHSPDGLVTSGPMTGLGPTFVGFDPVRGQGVALQPRVTAWSSDRTFVTSGAGWRLASNSSFGVFAPGVAFDPVNAELLAFGGTDSGQWTFFDTMKVWNGTQWSVRQAAVRPSPRMNAAMATDVARSRIVLF